MPGTGPHELGLDCMAPVPVADRPSAASLSAPDGCAAGVLVRAQRRGRSGVR